MEEHKNIIKPLSIIVILFLLIIGGGTYLYFNNNDSENINTQPEDDASMGMPVPGMDKDVDEMVVKNDNSLSSANKYKEAFGGISLQDGDVRKVNMTINNAFNSNEQFSDIEISYIVKIISDGDDYYVEKNYGPSADPHFEYYKEESGQYIYKGSTATGAVIPGNGFIYTNGTQNPFPHYRKYKLDSEGNIKYIKQPLDYIGMKSTAKSSFSLKNNEGEIILNITEGSPVEVVASEYSYSEENPYKTRYLIKTQYNIVGWYEDYVPSCFSLEFGSEKEVIESLCIGGD